MCRLFIAKDKVTAGIKFMQWYMDLQEKNVYAMSGDYDSKYYAFKNQIAQDQYMVEEFDTFFNKVDMTLLKTEELFLT